MTPLEKMQQGVASRVAEEKHPIGAITPLPPIISAHEFRQRTIIHPPEIIQNVLTQGARLVLAGPSKSRKSWVLLDLAYSVASGRSWLGFGTTQSHVLYVNFELRNHTIHGRTNQISTARTIQNDELLDLWDLRGFAKSIEEMVVEIRDGIAIRKPFRKPYGLIILDPSYKLLGARDENSAGEVTEFVSHLEWLAQESGAAIVVAAHFPKGLMGGRVSQDRIAGSGAFARDADAILTLNPHKESTESVPVFTVESTLREFPPIEPFVIRWEHPIMKVDPSADPKEISGRPGHPNDYSDQELLKFIPESGINKTDWKKAADAETGIGKSTFYRRAEELEKRGLVKQDPDTGLVKKSDFHSMFAQIKNAKRSIGGRPFNGN